MSFDQVIHLERIIKAPIETVFQYLVETEKLERWFYTDCKFDAEARSFSFWFVSRQRTDYDSRCFGTILRLEPYDRLVLEWNDGEFETTVEYVLRSVTNKCTFLALHHKNWSEAASYARLKQKNQWDFYLDNLRRVAEGQSDLRENFFAQVIRKTSPVFSEDE